MLFCKTIPGNRPMSFRFNEANRIFNVDWTKCIAICIDGAKAIIGKNSGLMNILIVIA